MSTSPPPRLRHGRRPRPRCSMGKATYSWSTHTGQRQAKIMRVEPLAGAAFYVVRYRNCRRRVRPFVRRTALKLSEVGAAATVAGYVATCSRDERDDLVRCILKRNQREATP